MYRMKWTIQNNNNAVLTADNAMPLKDSTSNNEGRFQMDRQTFIETIPSVIPTENKWMGESRDASDVMRRRRAGAVGKGTFNANNNQFSSPILMTKIPVIVLYAEFVRVGQSHL